MAYFYNRVSMTQFYFLCNFDLFVGLFLSLFKLFESKFLRFSLCLFKSLWLWRLCECGRKNWSINVISIHFLSILGVLYTGCVNLINFNVFLYLIFYSCRNKNKNRNKQKSIWNKFKIKYLTKTYGQRNVWSGKCLSGEMSGRGRLRRGSVRLGIFCLDFVLLCFVIFLMLVII